MPKTIGDDPLDSVIIDSSDTSDTEEEKEGEGQTLEEALEEDSGEEDEEQKEQKKVRMTVYVPSGLAERIRNAAYWKPGLTIADIAEEGMGQVMEEIEEENDGPFPDREEELKGGRPVK